jgi:hypothetical protein
MVSLKMIAGLAAVATMSMAAAVADPAVVNVSLEKCDPAQNAGQGWNPAGKFEPRIVLNSTLNSAVPLFLDEYQSGTSAGTNVIAWPFNGQIAKNQLWTTLGRWTGSIVSRNSGMCVDVAGAIPNLTNIMMYPCHMNDQASVAANQKWIWFSEDGTFRSALDLTMCLTADL